MPQEQERASNNHLNLYTKRQKQQESSNMGISHQKKQWIRRQERQRQYHQSMSSQVQCTCNVNRLQQELEALRQATKDALHQAWDEVESLNEKHAIKEKQVRYFMEQVEESQQREKKLIAKNQKIQELIQLKNKSQIQRKRSIDTCQSLNLFPQFQGQGYDKSQEETKGSKAIIDRAPSPLLSNQSILIPTINENDTGKIAKTEHETNERLRTTTDHNSNNNSDSSCTPRKEDLSSKNTTNSMFNLNFSKYSQIFNDSQLSTQLLLKRIGTLAKGTATSDSCDDNKSSCHSQGRAAAAITRSAYHDNYSFRPPLSAPPPLPPSSSSSVNSNCQSIGEDSSRLSSSPHATDVCNNCPHTHDGSAVVQSNEKNEDVHVLNQHIIMNNTTATDGKNKNENDDQTAATGACPSSSSSFVTTPRDQTPKLLAIDPECSRSDSIDESTNYRYIQDLKAKIESREKEIKSLEDSIQENVKMIQHLHLNMQR